MPYLRGKYRWLHILLVLAVPVALFAVVRERVSWLPTTFHLDEPATWFYFAPDGLALQILLDNGDREWRDTRTGQLIRQAALPDLSDGIPDNDPAGLFWSTDGSTVAALHGVDADWPCSACVWKTSNWHKQLDWTIPDGWCSLRFDPAGKIIASGSGRNGNVRLWDARTGALLHTWHSEIDRVSTLAFSPDGRYLAATGRDGVIAVWDTLRSHLVWSLHANTDPSVALLFSPDGRLLADVTDNVDLRDARTGRLVRTIYPGVGSPHIICFSPESTVLATGGNAGVVYLWNVATGKMLRMLVGDRPIITALAYSFDGAELASGSQDGTVKVWRVR